MGTEIGNYRMTRVYHGSNVAVESPLTGIGRRNLDFGGGEVSAFCGIRSN